MSRSDWDFAGLEDQVRPGHIGEDLLLGELGEDLGERLIQAYEALVDTL